MPKSTFFNLKPEKREKIEQAIVKEFGRISFENASISRIIEEAGIPRGSFYQYFEDKEDAICYILEKFMEDEKNHICCFLREKRGDIFETTFYIFDYMIERSQKEENINLYRNILQELKKQNRNLFIEMNRQKKEENPYDLIDIKKLNIEDKEDLSYMLKILTSIVRNQSIEVISHKMTKEQGREELSRQLEIVKKGMLKR